jgi:hypothetical protein
LEFFKKSVRPAPTAPANYPLETQMNIQENDRVRRHTRLSARRAIDEATEHNIVHFSGRSADEIEELIRQLDAEWSIERYLQANASILALSGAVLGLTASKRWFLLTAGVMGFLFQHGVQGWCPPMPIFRSRGVRTRGEIDREKFALKTARGDYVPAPSTHEAGSNDAS